MSGRCSVEYRVNDFSCRFFICIVMTPRKTILYAVQFYLGLIKVFRVEVVLSLSFVIFQLLSAIDNFAQGFRVFSRKVSADLLEISVR